MRSGEKLMDESAAQLEQRISALMDGECDTATLLRVEHDPAAQAVWLRYHQIGDLLRSPDLLPLPREQAFVRALSERIAQEPPPQQADAVGRWQAGLAALAGVAAAVLLTLRLPLQPSLQLAELSQPLHPVSGLIRAGWQASRNAARPPLLADAVSAVDAIPDDDWTPYLLAHQQLAPSPLGDPEPTWSGAIHAWR